MQYLSEMPSDADPDPAGGVEPLPPSIQILIVLFALFGAVALYDVLHALATDRISINFGVLQLFIAWGLFKRRNFWRGVGQAWIGLGIAAVLIFMLVTVVSPGVAQTIDASRATDWTRIARGAALGFFAFIGFEDMVNVAEEVKDPERNMPRAILTALLVTGIVYMAVVIVSTTVAAPRALGESEAPLLMVVERSTDAIPGGLFSLVALFAVANTGLLNFIMGSRLIYGMSRQGLLPEALGAVHPRRRTPHLAILAVLVIALALALSGTLTYLAGTTSLLLLIVFFTVHVSLVVIKRRDRDAVRTFCAPAMVPFAGALTCVALMPFVPPGSILTAAIILGLGVLLVVLRAAPSVS